MEFKKYFEIIKHWIWLLILGLLIGAALGYYFSSREAPVYQAESRFIILTAAPTSEFQLYYNYIDSEQLISTYTELLSAESTLEKASTELGFPVSQGQAQAQRVGETQFVKLIVKDEDPVKAAAIANGLVKIMIEQNEELQSIRYATTEQNLLTRLTQAEQQIETIQQQINDISSAAVENSLNEVTLQIENLQNEINDLERQVENIDPLIATDAQLSQLAEYQDQLDQLKPVLDLYQQIYTNLVVLGQGAQNTMSDYSQISQLQFTLDLYQEIYISSMASLESLRLSRAQSTPNVVQTEPARVPKEPISPKPVRTAALSGAVGFVVMGGLAFLIEYLDDTIKTPDEVKQVTGLPVIGFIANTNFHKSSKNKSNGDYPIFVVSQPRSSVSEAIRLLRTNLEFSAVDNPVKTILITSANPAEGKSTIAANLAMAMAQSGKKTLLLDADMRRPSVHGYFNLYNRIGLSDLLRNKFEIEQAVTSVESNSNLSVLTSGGLPPNPSELLSSEKLRRTLEILRAQYDVVIIDSSPMVVSDPQILASRVDGLIFVTQPGKTRINHLTMHIKQLDQINARILGIVFNRISRNRNTYYGSYYYSNYYTADENAYYDETFETNAKTES
jgi:capsular exopolysaccharide synthesis family protein